MTYLRSDPTERLVSTQPPINPNAGEYWMAQKEGEESWPVVICDEEMTQALDKGKRPVNALQTDGTWQREFNESESLAGRRCFPALYLGTMKFRWVPWQRLKFADFQTVVKTKALLTDEDLILAYDELLDCHLHNLSYWKDKLYAAKLQEEQESTHDLPMDKIDTYNKRKRVCSIRPRDPFCRIDGEKYLERPISMSNPKPTKVKREDMNPNRQIINTMSRAENDALYEDPDSPNQLSVSQSKRVKNGMFGRCNLWLTPCSSTLAETIGSSKVAIYIDNPWKIFIVPLESIPASPLFQRELRNDPVSGNRIMSPLLSNISKHHFQSVAEYLMHSEYYPPILDKDTPTARLENIVTEQEYRDEMLRCGAIYCISRDLEMPELGSLVIQKLETLEEAGGLAREFVTVVREVFRSADSGALDTDDDVQWWLTNRVADRFWELVLAETELLVEVLTEHKELAKGVFRILSGVKAPKIEIRDGVEAVTDQRVKEEGGGHDRRDDLENRYGRVLDEI